MGKSDISLYPKVRGGTSADLWIFLLLTRGRQAESYYGGVRLLHECCI